MQTVLTTGLDIRGDGPSVIVSFHNNKTRAKDHQEGQDVPLPHAADYDTFCRSGRNFDFRFHQAHRRNPPVSSLDKAASVMGSFAVLACTHTEISGIRGSLVEHHIRM